MLTRALKKNSQIQTLFTDAAIQVEPLYDSNRNFESNQANAAAAAESLDFVNRDQNMFDDFM